MLGTGLGLARRQLVSGGGATYLHDIEPSTCCDLDATVEDSYGGTGQTWANLTPSPADGADQTDYDFYIGTDGTADTTDPTFTGSAGDSGAYFAHGGDDYYELISATNPTLFADMPKTSAGNSWWLTFSFRTGPDITSAGFYLFDTRFGSGSGDGIVVLWNKSASVIQVGQKQGASTSTHNLTGTALSNNTDYILTVSYDKDTDTIRYWLNTNTNSSISAAFSAGTSDADDTPTIASAHGAVAFHSGMRNYSFAAGNDFLDDTKAQAIHENIAGRQTEGRYSFL